MPNQNYNSLNKQIKNYFDKKFITVINIKPHFQHIRTLYNLLCKIKNVNDWLNNYERIITGKMSKILDFISENPKVKKYL